jgi:ribosomal protein L29
MVNLRLSLRVTVLCVLAVTAAALALPPSLAAQAAPAAETLTPSQLTERIRELEQQLARLKTSTPVAQAAAQQNPPANPQTPAMQMPMPPAVTGPVNPEDTPPDSTDPKALLDRIKALEQRIRDLESSAVLSEPETRVREVEIWVDKDGNQYDHEMPGTTRKTTYQRERVYRRQTINEKIEEALDDATNHSVEVGVDAGIVAQFAHQTRGATVPGNNHAYELASADLFFTAGVAQHTLFFADIVGLSGPNPEGEIPVRSLINGYSARLVNQNELNLREAWLRTELFGQRLAITAGRLDLTNYFDHNVAANDETTQFLSDALVNNQALGLSENGAGLSIVFDPKSGINFKVGLQQSSSTATSLSDSIFSLAEVGFLVRPPGLSEGNYRFWYRTDNGGGTGYKTGYGASIDQKIFQGVTLFGRYGASQADVKRDHFYSAGVQFDNGRGFFPGDAWGLGYAQNDFQDVDPSDPFGIRKERLVEGYYRFGLTEKLNLSAHVQYFYELVAGGGDNLGYIVPGVRLQASF